MVERTYESFAEWYDEKLAKREVIWIEVLHGGNEPRKAHSNDSCWDCYAWGDYSFGPLGTMKIKLGFKLQLPWDFEAQIRPRSGLSLAGILGHFGTIDADYRGEVCAILTNLSSERTLIEDGSRVCQLYIQKKDDLILVRREVEVNTDRGEGGFGSTGQKEFRMKESFDQGEVEIMREEGIIESWLA